MGASPSGDTVVHVGAAPGQALLGWHVSRSMYLLVFELFLWNRVLKEMEFEVLYWGTVVGKGSVTKMGNAGVGES